jgi:ATP-dependent Lon protease
VKKTIAMTGEISLRGMVLPIGGLKEKLLAAVRGGIQEVVIPHKNVKDLEEIPANVKEQLEIIPVKTIAEVFAKALVKRLSPTEWKIKKMEKIDNINQKEVEQTENIIKH